MSQPPGYIVIDRLTGLFFLGPLVVLPSIKWNCFHSQLIIYSMLQEMTRTTAYGFLHVYMQPTYYKSNEECERVIENRSTINVPVGDYNWYNIICKRISSSWLFLVACLVIYTPRGFPGCELDIRTRDNPWTLPCRRQRGHRTSLRLAKLLWPFSSGPHPRRSPFH